MTEKTEQEQAIIDAAKKFVECQIPDAQKYGSQLHDAVKAYQQSIKPKTDWSKMPYLTPIMCNGQKSYFLFMAGDTIRALEDGGDDVLSLYPENCTLIPSTYTEPVWHKWTDKRPDWVQDDDFVIYRRPDKYLGGNRAGLLYWDSKGIEFAVIKGGQN